MDSRSRADEQARRTGGVGINYYLEELARGDAARQTAKIVALTKAIAAMTAVMLTLTIVIAALTLVIVVSE